MTLEAGHPSTLSELLRSLEPVLHEGVVVYSSVPPGTDLSGIEVLGTFREAEGVTVLAREEEALRAGLPILFRAAWVTLTVHSDLEAVGLTAAFATALAEAGISCNVIAGAYHDHLFVPVEKGEAAMEVLRAMQRSDHQAPQTIRFLSTDPEVMGGTPVFAGTRVPVQTLFDYLEAGESVDDFLEGFPSVQWDQVVQILETAKDLFTVTHVGR